MSDLLLLSGGIDSAALAALTRPSQCLTIDYGQRPAKAEIAASAQICKDLKLNHIIISANISHLGAGDLSGLNASPHSTHSEFWPFRNQFLVTLGAMAAIKYQCDRVLIGTVVTDKRHLDGSPQFIEVLNSLLGLQEGSIQLSAPAAAMTSPGLIRKSKISISTLGWCHSCHAGDLACNQCRGCQKHSEIMLSLGLAR